MFAGFGRSGRRVVSRRGQIVGRRTRAVADALERRVLLSTELPTGFVQPSATAAIPLSNSTWTPMGPGALGNGNSGRLAAVAADPNNANVLYIAAAGGGVWKTIDAGASWTPLTDSQSTLFMGALAVAPSNPNVIYAGTGEATSSIFSFYGRGVLKSTDGGATWALTGNSVFNRRTISQMAVDPTNADTLYVAVAGGGVNGAGGTSGIWKSVNGGTSWTNTTGAISTSAAFTDVRIDPTNPQRLLCAVGNSSTAAGVYVTTNGGASWTLETGGIPAGNTLGNAKVAIAPSNPQVLYASFADPSTGGLLSMWASTNGGTTWSQLATAPNYMGGQGWYDSTLAVDPYNSAVVYAAGSAGSNSVIESTDGGQTWNDIHTGTNGVSPHADHHGIGFDADGHLLDGNDGGIWRLNASAPGSIAWANLNANLQITQFVGGTLDPTNPNSAFAGSQDNGVEQYTGSTVWTVREGGDGGLVKINQQNPSIVYHQAPIGSLGATNFFRKSTDGGVTWSGAVSGIGSESQNFYAPFFVDPTNGSHLFYGTNRIYESTNAAGAWGPISTTNTSGWTSTSNVNTIAMAPSNPSTIYATAGGSMFVTTNDGATWTAVNPLGVAGSAANLLVDPGNSLVCYMVTSSFGIPHVLKTIDGGANWTNISGNLPDLPTYDIALNPAANTIYVGNDNGVYASTDGGTTWSAYGFGLPNAEVRDLEYNASYNTLAAFTHGRGMFEISTALPGSIVVNTAVDETTAGDGLTSLREAVAQANAAGGGTISFASSLVGGSVSLTGGALLIGNGVVINGPNSRALTIVAAAGSPLEIAGGAAVTIADLVVSGMQTVLQVDSTGQASLLDVSVRGDVVDNGSLSFYQAINDSLSGFLRGSGSLTKTGPQTLTVSGLTNYLGGTTVTAGTLAGNTGSLWGAITVSFPGTLAFDQSTNPRGLGGEFDGAVSGTGTVRVVGPSSIVQLGTTDGVTPSTLTNSGPTVIDAGTSLFALAANEFSPTSLFVVNGTLNLCGFGEVIGALAGAASGLIYNVSTQANLTATLTVGGNNASTVFDGLLEDVPVGSVNGGRLALVKTGTGTLSLSRPGAGPNTYTGGTTISFGTLAGNSAGLEGSIADNASLRFDQTLASIGDGTFAGAVTGPGTVNFASGVVRLGAGSTLRNSGATTVAGTLVGPATGGLNALSNVSAYSVGGVLDLGGFDQTIASLSGDGTVYHFRPNGQSALATLTLGGDNASTAFTGVFADTLPASGNSGTLAVTKVGSGTFTVTGASTFTGGLTVSAGELDVGPSNADPMGAGTVTLSGGTLALEGRVAATVQQLIAATGYNQDVIAEAAVANAQAGTSSAFDGNYVWYEQGFTGASGTGLPLNGTTFTSAANAAVSFKLQPYTASNVAFINGGNGSVTLTLTTPAAFATLNILAAAANGNANMTATLHFADASTAVAQVAVSDWFNGSGAAVTAGGRIIRSTTSSVTLTSGNPRLYEYDYAIPLNSRAKLLASITFNETSGNQLGIFGLSGAASVVQAAQSYPNAIRVIGSSTIDVENSLAASLGGLTMDAGQLSLTGPSAANLTFGAVTANVNSTFNTAPGTTLSLGAIVGGGNGLTKMGAGTLVLTAADSYAGGTTVSAGALSAATATSVPANTGVSIGAAGTLAFQPNGFTANFSSLSISAGGKLDIGNNALFIRYASPGADPIAVIKAYIVNGYNGGAWTGTAANGSILSSSAANDPQHVTGIGYADYGDGTNANTTANSILLRCTVIGDTDLDGTVGLNDYTAVVRNFGVGTNWDQGAVTYGPTVNLNDYTAVVRNFGKNVPTPAAVPAKAAAVPGANGSASATGAAAVEASASSAVVTTVSALEDGPQGRQPRGRGAKRR